MAKIQIDVEGESHEVDKQSYIVAKTKQMVEFGYPDLTEAETEKLLDEILEGKKQSNIIGMFIEQDEPKLI